MHIADWYKFIRKRSIGRRFAIYILAFSSVVTLASTVLQLSIEYNKDVNKIDSNFIQIKESYSKSLSSSLWVTSQKDLGLQLDGIIKLPDMQYIEVVSEKDEVLAFRGTKKAERIISQTYFLKHTYRGKELILGELHIVATLDGIYARLQDKVLVILLTQTVKTFVVSLFILYLFQILVGRHLATISQFLTFKDKKLDDEMKLNRKNTKSTQGDELDQMVNTSNKMRKKLSLYIHNLTESEKNLNKAQKISHIGSWQFNMTTRAIDWSSEVYRIYELEPFSQTIDYDWYVAHLHSDDVVMVQDSIKKALSGQKAYDNKHRILTAKGNVRFVHQKAEVYFEDNMQKVSGTIQDITEKTKQEIHLINQSRMAQMGEMISMIAHQWRQPLGAISSTSIDMQMKSQLENFDLEQKEEAQKYEAYINSSLKDIDSYVENLTTTIDDFRNFYKSNKKIATNKLSNIISKSLNIISKSLEISNIEIVHNCNSKQEIQLYDKEVMQVILNILKNAEDNFKEKRIKNPKITILTEDRKISICDNGGGIADNIIDRIFDPYFSTKDETNGTGLGLYMSKMIIQNHHAGKLYVENIVDVQGTNIGVCFNILIGNFIDSYNE